MDVHIDIPEYIHSIHRDNEHEHVEMVNATDSTNVDPAVIDRAIDSADQRSSECRSETSDYPYTSHTGDGNRSTESNGNEDIEDDDDLNYGNENDNETDLCPELVTIDMNTQESLTGSNEIMDYRFRSVQDPFNQMNLWEHTEYIMKITRTAEERRKIHNTLRDIECMDDDETLGRQPSRRPGRHALERGTYKEEHPQFETHVCRYETWNISPLFLEMRCHDQTGARMNMNNGVARC
jgi:hypothetical protein